jgi:hypothetical protein
MIKAKLYMNVHWVILYKRFREENLWNFSQSEHIFEISANQSILLALAAMLNIWLERKTETL